MTREADKTENTRLRDAYRRAASNLILEEEAREILGMPHAGLDEEEEAVAEEPGELIACQEWCGFHAGSTELYKTATGYRVDVDGELFEYDDLKSALAGSGVLVETDATVSIWYDEHLIPAELVAPDAT